MQFYLSNDPEFDYIVGRDPEYATEYLNVPYLKCSMALAAGSSDCIEVRYYSGKFNIVTTNDSLGYIGLEVFSYNRIGGIVEVMLEGDIFIPGMDSYRSYEIFGEGVDFLKYTTPTQIRKLLPYI